MLEPQRLLVFDVSEQRLQLSCLDLERGVEVARCAADAASETAQVIAATARGDAAVFITNDARLHVWDIGRGTVEPCAYDLRGKNVRLNSRASSVCGTGAMPRSRRTSHTSRIGSGSIRTTCNSSASCSAPTARRSFATRQVRTSFPCAITWHPERPLIGVLGDNKLSRCSTSSDARRCSNADHRLTRSRSAAAARSCSTTARRRSARVAT